MKSNSSQLLFEKYFRDTDFSNASKKSIITRVLEKGTTQEIKLLIDIYSFGYIQQILTKSFMSDRIQFSPNLVALFSLRFNISDDISKRALKRSKENDFFTR